MDNRKIYKKQKPSKNLLTKVKRFFSGSIWNGTTIGEPTIEKIEVKRDDPITTKPEPEVVEDSNHLITTPTSKPLSGSDKTPNVLLSEFFQQKGNTPLTAVEYEGVMSLLSQSHKKDFIMPGTFSKSPIKSGSLTKEATPINQKVLSNSASPKKFATPEYKPLRHNVTSSRTKEVPSVKRIYQFSGLPSPYRTKIKTPSMTPNKRLKEQSFDKSLLESSSLSHRPINKAASTLLSVLDDSKRDSTSNFISQFSNPYMSNRKSNTLTAGVINSTIMFDKSHDLPDSSNSSVTTPAETASYNPDKLAETKSEPKIDILSDSSVPVSKIPSTNEPITKSNHFGFESQPISKPESSQQSTASEGSSIPKQTQSKEELIVPERAAEPQQTSEPSVPKPTFQFKPSLSTTTFKSDFKPNPTPNSMFKPAVPVPNESNDTDSSFKFPSLKPQRVELDNLKVEEYKKSFTFNV